MRENRRSAPLRNSEAARTDAMRRKIRAQVQRVQAEKRTLDDLEAERQNELAREHVTSSIDDEDFARWID